jgi:hypothetical protein
MVTLAMFTTLAALVACRFGGPSANPYEYVVFPDATAEGGGGSTFSDDAGAMMTGDETMGLPGDDGGGPDGGIDDTSSDACASTADVAVCDPIHNTGCNPLQQCDVSSLQSSPPTGNCVFNSGSTDAGGCTTSVFSESCPAKSTCVDGGCRQLCVCNGDCPVGQCCADTSGPAGFTLCGSCP